MSSAPLTGCDAAPVDEVGAVSALVLLGGAALYCGLISGYPAKQSGVARENGLDTAAQSGRHYGCFMLGAVKFGSGYPARDIPERKQFT